MRIGLQTWGSAGDVRPMLALAGGLSAAGHEVTLAVASADNTDYSALAEPLGITLVQAESLLQEFDRETMKAFEQQYYRIRSSDFMKQLRLIMDYGFFPFVDEMYAASLDLCAASDIVVGHMLVHTLKVAAIKTGTPRIVVSPNHMLTSYSRAAYPAPDLGPWLNRGVWKLGMRMYNGYFLERFNTLCIREGMAPFRGMDEAMFSDLLALIAVSSVFCREGPDMEDQVRVCGRLSLPENAVDWVMPAGLKEFLEGGEPPVFISFGSWSTIESDPSATAALAVNAAQLAGVRAIVQQPWDKVSGVDDDARVYKLSRAPHSRIFPHCAAVVHHGGAGTTHTVTRYGCPSVVVHFLGEQLFWAKELKRLGVAHKALPRKKLTAEKLAGAIRRVLDDRDMKPRAERLGTIMLREDGVGTAVKLIEEAAGREDRGYLH